MIEILYCTHNRLEFTRKTLGLLLDSLKGADARVWWNDDYSTDGTVSGLRAFADTGLINVLPPGVSFSGPVSAMNHFLTMRDSRRWDDNPSELVCKIDNDVALPPGWLKTCMVAMERHEELDLLGIEPMDEDPMSPAPIERCISEHPRSYRAVDHIGGIGMFRMRPFRKHGLPTAHDRFFGFTKWQTSHDDIVKGWLYPALPVALLDRIPVDPWRSLARSYCDKGWSRPWPPYSLTERREQWEWVL